MNKISIIVPFYNTEKYLEECINSVIKQTYTNWELILIDDDSIDNSANVCKKYLSDARIKYLYQEHCGLPGVGRNVGIYAASGKYIMFLDSDDFLEKDTLKILYHLYLKNKVELAICNFRKIKDSSLFNIQRTDNIVTKDKLFNRNDIISYALKTLDQQNKNVLFNFCWGKLYNAKIIKKNNIWFDKELYTFEDITFNFNYLKFVNKIIYTNKILYNYKIHEDKKSATFNTDLNRFFNYIKSLYLIKSFFYPYLDRNILNKKIRNAIISLTIIQLIRAGVSKDNRKEMFNFYDKILNHKDIRKSLIFYRPNKGESILIPLLIFLKLKKILIKIITYKSRKRYEYDR